MLNTKSQSGSMRHVQSLLSKFSNEDNCVIRLYIIKITKKLILITSLLNFYLLFIIIFNT